MGELYIHADVEFNKSLETMTVEELQNLLLQLEKQLEDIKKQRELEIKKDPEKDRLGNIKPMQGAVLSERAQLNSKILKCRKVLLERLYGQASEKFENHIPAIPSRWVIAEKEPVNIIENVKVEGVYWEKHGGEAPVQQSNRMTITECGDFRWSSNPQISARDMLNGPTQIPFEVPSNKTESGTIEVKAEDLRRALQEVETQYLELKLVRVTVQSAEKIEYYMLMSIPTSKYMDENQKGKLQQFLAKTYMSDAHQKMVEKSLKKGRCPFGGIISQAEERNFILNFDDRYISAIEDANNFEGLCKTLEGEKKVVGSLLDATDTLDGRQKRRETLGVLERIDKGIEGR